MFKANTSESQLPLILPLAWVGAHHLCKKEKNKRLLNLQFNPKYEDSATDFVADANAIHHRSAFGQALVQRHTSGIGDPKVVPSLSVHNWTLVERPHTAKRRRRLGARGCGSCQCCHSASDCDGRCASHRGRHDCGRCGGCAVVGHDVRIEVLVVDEIHLRELKVK